MDLPKELPFLSAGPSRTGHVTTCTSPTQKTIFFPPNTSDPLGLPFHHSFSFEFDISFSDDLDMVDLVDLFDIADKVNLDAYNDAVIPLQGSGCPSKSPGPDPTATTLIPSSRESVTQGWLPSCPLPWSCESRSPTHHFPSLPPFRRLLPAASCQK